MNVYIYIHIRIDAYIYINDVKQTTNKLRNSGAIKLLKKYNDRPNTEPSGP